MDNGYIHALGYLTNNFRPKAMSIYHVDMVRGTKWAIGQTNKLFILIFQVEVGHIYFHFSLRCAIMSAINYDILGGQQTF